MVVILIGALMAAAILLLPNKHDELSNIDINQCIKSSQFSCYSDYYTSKTKSSTPVMAIEDLKKLALTDTYAKAQCHQLAHVIGHEAYEIFGSLSEAYTKGDSYCWSGYYHGVTESAVGALGASKIKEQANNICKQLSDKQKYSFDHFNCVHGLGHGFMTVDSFKLFDALKTCDILQDSWEQSSCYGGVFMENVMVAVRGDGTSEYLHANELMYPCTAVDTAYKEQCYLMQTSYALKQNGYDFAGTAKLCQNIPDSDYIDTCYQSLGRDASGTTNSDVVKTKEYCDASIDTEGLKNCVLGAVRDIISYYHDDTQAKAFCAQYNTDLSEICSKDTDNYYATFTPRED